MAFLPQDLIFLDESGVNLAMTRRYARAKKGERAYASAPVNRGKNVSIIGAMGISGMICAWEVQGGVNGEEFLHFVKEELAPHLKPGQGVVMDNLSAHHVAGVREAIEAKGAFLLYLPPYSPQWSPIELMWSKFKAFLRSIAARAREVLSLAVEEAFDTVTPNNAKAWFAHCGYRTSSN